MRPTAEGRWVISNREDERQVILDFARYFVKDVSEGAFAGDRARLAGWQLNTFTCIRCNGRVSPLGGGCYGIGGNQSAIAHAL